MTSTTPSVSVIVPVYNGGRDFHHCLNQLFSANPSPHEVIVVSDGDTDGSGDLAAEFGANVLRLPEPGGPARARNTGAATATGDILFFVDADVEIKQDTIAKVAQIFAANPEVAAAMGSYDDTPSAPNFLSQYKNLFHHYTHQMGCEEASTFWGACGAVRREVFQAVGGFDARYRKPCIEDIELGYRLKRAGHRILLCKMLQVKHRKHWTLHSMLRADFFYRALPWMQLILRDRNPVNDLNLNWTNRASVMLLYGGLLSLFLGMVISPVGFAITLMLWLVLLGLNWSVYRFFARKRGVWFALQVIPWHWFYYFYSGLALIVGVSRHTWESLMSQRTPKRPA